MNRTSVGSSVPLEPAGVRMARTENALVPVGSPAAKEKVRYGKHKLSSLPVLWLPTDKPRIATAPTHFALRSRCVDRSLSESLRQLARDEQVPFSAVLLSSFQILLRCYSSQPDFAIGCSLADFDIQRTDGLRCAENQFLLHTELSSDPDFRTLLTRVNTAVVKALSETPLQQQQLMTEPEARGAFQVSFSYRAPAPHANPKPVSPKPKLADVPLELCLEAEESREDLELRIVYNPELFEAGSIDRILNNFQTLLRGVAQNPDQQISRLPILSEQEKRQILVDWNQTACDYPSEKCLHELIEAQAELVPERDAVICGSRTLSYRELNRRANQVAHYLRSRGVGPNAKIGICLEPSADFAVAVLAVLKSGAACVPLDPNYPAERLAYMLQDLQARMLITQKGLLREAAPIGCEVLFLADAEAIVSSQLHSNPTSGVKPGDIAYVIYTSGSTGKPRGVLLTHAGLVNYNTNAARMYSVTSSDRVLQFCSVSFDIAIEEFFITWVSGAALVLRTAEMPLAVPDFLDWVERQRVTVLDLPTAYWHEWMHEVPRLNKVVPQHLRLVIVGGEKPSREAYATWAGAVGSRVRWINTYGPTETSICATAFEPDASAPIPGNIPIGRPLANTRVYLLDRHLNPVPVGVPGEVHIGGVGVARGYLNRPELTAEKFVADPFCSDPEARLYKTGDRARYLPGGDIEFLGRADDQVKIRGFRVELGEIEAALAKHPDLREAAVIAREDGSGGKQLVAYLVSAQETKPSISEIRSHLQQELPDYMIPSTFVFLPAMPLTPNGKINRRGLPEPEDQPLPDALAIATDALEAQLVGLWEDVMGKRPIGIRDNFFEIGGHSLLAARLMHRIGQALGKTLPLAMLFHAPTIEQLATVLRQGGWSQHWSSLVPIQPGGSQPPFFCIHGVGGNVLGFHRLGRRIAPDYPFYGLQSQGLDGKRPCLTSVPAMAAHYIAEMRTVQPRGPYFLGGFSFGGLIAYEIAQQLRALGEEAALLVLFDTYPGSSKTGTASLLKTLLQSSRANWFRHVPRAISKKLRRTWRNLSVPKALWDVFYANRAAAKQYVLRPYDGKVTLVRATEQAFEHSVDPHAAWNDLASNLVVHEIASDHYDILLEPQVSQLAERLKAWIDNGRSEYQNAAHTKAQLASD